MRLGLGGNPKGGAPLASGQAPSPWLPPSRSHLEGAGPLPPSLINRGARGGLHRTSKAQPLPSATPLLLRRSLVKPCRSTAASPSPCRNAAIGALFLNLSLLLAGSRCARRHRAARVLNAEVSWFDTRSELHRDLNRREYDSINCILATLPLSDLQRYEDALTPLSLLVSP